MKRLLMFVMLLTLFGCPLMDQEATAAEPPQAVWGNPQTVAGDAPVVVRVPADTKGELTAFALRKGPTWKQRRAMGVTFGNACKAMAEMQKAGELEDQDSATLAAEILGRLLDKNPAAFQSVMQAAGGDWQEFIEWLLALIEKWIPLILKIISLLS